MGLLVSKGSRHIDGNKSYTLHKEIVLVNDKKVFEKIYVPTLQGNGRPIDFTVKEGDQVKRGQKIGLCQGFFVPVFAPVSGKIIAQETRYNALVGRPIPYIVIENDFQNSFASDLPIYDYEKLEKDQIIAAIKQAGIVGLGGAGFPTYVKYEGCKNIETLLINGCECEPYLTTDYERMIQATDKLFKGINLLMRACGAKVAYLAIKKGKPELKAKLEEAIKNNPGVELKLVDDVYPIGWERTLVRAVIKKEYNLLPSEIGVIVNNSQTTIAVAEALLEGKPITERLVTVSGAGIKNSANVVVPVGTPVEKIVEFLGGYTEENVVLLTGGPMTSKGQMNDKFVIEKQMGGLTVLKHETYVEDPCLRCGECTLNCPARLQPVEIKDAVIAKDLDRIRALKADKCVECGMCSYVCPSRIEVTEYMRKAKLQLRVAAAKAAPKK